eukprot:347243_1
MDYLLKNIKNSTHIHQSEVNYIRQLMERAKLFHDNAFQTIADEARNTRWSPERVRNDKISTVHMNDILDTMIKASDDVVKMRYVLMYINDKQYDTDDVIDDLNRAAIYELIENTDGQSIASPYFEEDQPIRSVANFMSNSRDACLLSDDTYEITGSQNIIERFPEKIKKHTQKIINNIWTSNCVANEAYFESNLLRINTVHSNKHIDPQYDGLTFNVLNDIYNVHKCFLFANYRFKHYDVHQFVTDIQNCNLDHRIKQCIEAVEIEDDIATIDLYPTYIIDDDMYTIC